MTDFKRTNYATGQFLVAADFQREQDYHRALGRLHAAELHTSGIVRGLAVTQASDTDVRVDPGSAIDPQGNHLNISDPVLLSLEPGTQDGALQLTLTYHESMDASDRIVIGGTEFHTATREHAKFTLVRVELHESDTPPSSGALVLGTLYVRDGKLDGINPGLRRMAGAVLPPDISVGTITTTGWCKIPYIMGSVDILGGLTVGGALNATGGSVVFSQLQHRYDSRNAETEGYATIQNSLDHNGLLISGRVVTPPGGGTSMLRVVRIVDLLDVVGTLRISNGVQPADLYVAGSAYFSGNSTVSGNLVVGTNFSVQGYSYLGTAGSVAGSFHVAGNLSVSGTAYLRAKSGYVMDQFINRLDEELEIGDVVVVRDEGAVVYFGQDEAIPIPEVDLTDASYDTRVCGIVCDVHGEVVSDNVAEPRIYSEEDKSQIDTGRVGPGQIGHMVTMGAYAHCKVDADIAPIRAGDLLTSSPTRGHAQKVLDRSLALGAIIGKALAPLASGRGRIPILVTLQ